MYSWITLQPLYPVLASVGSWDCCCCWRLWENKIVTKTWYKKCIYPNRKFQKAKTAQFYKTRILEQVLRQISKWGREVTPVSATFEYSEPFISFHTKHRWKERDIYLCNFSSKDSRNLNTAVPCNACGVLEVEVKIKGQLRRDLVITQCAALTIRLNVWNNNNSIMDKLMVEKSSTPMTFSKKIIMKIIIKISNAINININTHNFFLQIINEEDEKFIVCLIG